MLYLSEYYAGSVYDRMNDLTRKLHLVSIIKHVGIKETERNNCCPHTKIFDFFSEWF
jgi:hypothetical protein